MHKALWTPIILALAIFGSGCSLGIPTDAVTGTDGNLNLQAADNTGSLSIAMDLPQPARGVQALPQGTAIVNIQITGPNLPNAITQAVDTAQFVNGKAVLQVAKIPVGQIEIVASCFDSGGNSIASGTAQATIAANQTSTVSLIFVQQAPGGNLNLQVDSTISAPTPVVTIGSPQPTL